jgi:glutamate--cysteine ligase catalytic subunit
MIYVSRAAGKTMTDAGWMRSFVHSHPSYRHDSVVTNDIATDLMKACADIGTGKRACPEILGSVRIDR